MALKKMEHDELVLAAAAANRHAGAVTYETWDDEDLRRMIARNTIEGAANLNDADLDKLISKEK